ncbi:MAG: hypothetical protein MH204_09865 [Fimbriimonadaceae bacterium]|nr:hypothetical protein [Fimbriimonadaceae bacterium]
MPHVRLEVTENMPEAGRAHEFLPGLVELLSGFETVTPSAVKSNLTIHRHWAMGEGAMRGYAHVEVLLLEGRSDELLKRVADTFHLRMLELFAESVRTGQGNATVEVRDMRSITYRK